MGAVSVLEAAPEAARSTVAAAAATSSSYTMHGLTAAYQAGRTAEAMQIAEAMLGDGAGSKPELNAKVQFILAWALTEHGWYRMAQYRLEHAAQYAVGQNPELRVMILAQYALTMLKFMVNEPELYEEVCGRGTGFDVSLSIMRMLDREIAGQGNPDNLRALYRQTDAMITRIRARDLAA